MENEIEDRLRAIEMAVMWLLSVVATPDDLDGFLEQHLPVAGYQQGPENAGWHRHAERLFLNARQAQPEQGDTASTDREE